MQTEDETMKWAIFEGQPNDKSAFTAKLTKVSRDYDNSQDAAKALYALLAQKTGAPCWCLSEEHPSWRN